MKSILFSSFFVVGLLIASEPGVAGPASGVEAPECPICLQPVNLNFSADNPEEAAVTTTSLFGCTHPEHFHKSCLAGLAKCPLCRHSLDKKPVQPDIEPAVQPPAVAPVPPMHVTHINQIINRYRADLQALDLSDLNINIIDGSVFEQINAKWPNLKQLYLSNNLLLDILCPEIGQLHNLQECYLNHTLIAGLPSQIDQLTNLQKLDLSNNPRLTGLPSQISALVNLQELYCSNNPLLNALPSQIGQLTSLQKLVVSNNPLLAGLPSQIGGLRHLQELYCSNNPLLDALPPEIGQLHNLRKLVLSDNPRLAALPEIDQLRNLRQLDLKRTLLVQRPDWRTVRERLQKALSQQLSIFDQHITVS